MILKTERLEVHVRNPEDTSFQHRFDHAGFIRQVILDGRHTFCGQENNLPFCGCLGEGLCCEFGIDGAVGDDDVAVGMNFLKLGCGEAMRRSDRPYFFAEKTTVVPVDTVYSYSEKSASFVSTHTELNGYAAVIERKIHCEGSALSVTTTLKNTGQKRIVTDEYCHNFLAINNHHMGQPYRLTLTPDCDLSKHHRVLYDGKSARIPSLGVGDTFTHKKQFSSPQRVSWIFEYTPDALAMRVNELFDCSTVALWSESHVFSVEVFKPVSVAPGEQDTWTRQYIFSQNGK